MEKIYVRLTEFIFLIMNAYRDGSMPVSSVLKYLVRKLCLTDENEVSQLVLLHSNLSFDIGSLQYQLCFIMSNKCELINYQVLKFDSCGN